MIATSLHARIVAAAYGVPRVSLAKPKPTRYARLWDPDMPFDVALEGLDAAVEAACARRSSPTPSSTRRASPAPLTRTSRTSLGWSGAQGREGVTQRLADRHEPQLRPSPASSPRGGSRHCAATSTDGRPESPRAARRLFR